VPLVLQSCSSASQEEWPRPSEEHVLSRIARANEGELLLAATFSGGGAGDTTFRLLACPRVAARCEVLAAIDANEGERPMLEQNDGGIALVVTRNDYISGFRNYSRTIESLAPGTISIRYR
jgi:hypothetical protein